MIEPVRSITQNTARRIDEWLLDPKGGCMSLLQLMEVAGNLVAQCCVDYLAHTVQDGNSRMSTIICVLAGNGNNGGDGLVAARCLSIMGYQVRVYTQEQKANDVHDLLLKQLRGCTSCQIIAVGELGEMQSLKQLPADRVLVMDCITGFGFNGSALRAPWSSVLDYVTTREWPIIAVDVPSGWCVDSDTPSQYNKECWRALISLTYPKKCSSEFTGRHYLAGRFLSTEKLASFDCVDLFPSDNKSNWILLNSV